MKIADHKRFKTNGEQFVLLSQSGAIFEIDAPTQAVLDHDRLAASFTRQDFLSSIDGSEEDKKALWTDLTMNRMLIPGETDARKDASRTVDEPDRIPLQTLVLQVTGACNLSCRYCYHGLDERKTHKSQPAMGRDVARKAVDFLLEMSGDLKNLTLVFFGGEPLLNIPLISETVHYADRTSLKAGKKIEYAVTTNGSLLTAENIKFLNANKIGTTISLDGDKVQHDRFRCFPDGSPSYGIIEPKVAAFLASGPPKPVVARVTIAKEVPDLSKSLHHLLNLGFAEAGFAPVTTNAADFQLDSLQMKRLLGQFQRLSEAFVQLALKGEFLGFTNLVDLLVTLHEGDVKPYPCGAGIGMFSVDSHGDLFLCQRLTGDASAMMGDVFAGFHKDNLKFFRQNAGLNQKEDCTGCWAASICAGGCYHEAKIREGDLFSPNLHYCQWIKDWIGTGLVIYGRLVRQAPGFLDKLSMLRGHTPVPGQLI